MKIQRIDAVIVVTGVGFPLVAVLIDRFSVSIDLLMQLSDGVSWYYQVFGAVIVVPLVAVIVQRSSDGNRYLKSVNDLSRSIFRELNPSHPRLIALAAAAGIGEELLFRGVIQPLLGIIPASIFFAALHTGFRFSPPAWAIYSGIVFLLSVTLGMIARYIGLPAAIVCHGIWDYTVLFMLFRDRHRITTDLNHTN
ncbi:CPBP family intramembrane metalloprotease [bacterium]|nr:CPBP family intramembrane metalloprotease [candidate division CSSED10-310 bacterium]